MLRWLLAAFSVGGTLAGLGFAAKQTSVKWAIVLWAIAGASFLALMVGPAVGAMRASWRASRKRSWQQYRPRGDWASAMVHRWSDPVPSADFGLGVNPGKQYIVETRGKVRKIAFTSPLKVTVSEDELPRTLTFRWRRYRPDPTITVHAFTDDGVVLEDRVPRPIQASMHLYR